MAFKNARFIKPSKPFIEGFSQENSSSIFLKRFYFNNTGKDVYLRICALGIGYAYINGQRVSEDLFTAPPSNYEKRLWYSQYNVTKLLNDGENVISVLCGNGFLNEDMKNAWASTEASWRDHPKVILELYENDNVILCSDETWDCSLNSPYLMNRYRQGVVYDSRIPLPWEQGFDINGYNRAVIDDRAPSGKFTLYESEPIRELAIYEPKNINIRDKKTRIFDFGVNMSGYVRLFTEGKEGLNVTIRYGETLTEEGALYSESIMSEVYFPEGEFATERFICNGRSFEWSTQFSYYGFRYAQIECDDWNAIKKVQAIFVGQDIERRSHFECSDEFLNRLYACGIQATRSNLFYMPTDCPTREKYGWMNDAQSSSEQILTNFHAEKMFLQWNVNICDAFTEDKGLPGIVPTHGWGYDWGNGPVSDGSLFEHVYRVYLHSGNKQGLIYNLPYFKRYLAFLKRKEDENGFINFGLYDWANPNQNICTTPLEFINAIYRVKFNRIASLAAKLSGESDEEFLSEEKRQIEIIKRNWILADGSCSVNEQTALSMLIYHGIYDNLTILKKQLKLCVESKNFHHDCGMVGLRHLYMALNICGLQEYAMRIVTAVGYPSYSEWLEKDATTLWEMWDCKLSRNHHMYSDVLSWIMKTVAGISPNDNAETFEKIDIKPYFFKNLDYVTAYYDSPKGRVEVAWKIQNNKIELTVISPCRNYVRYKGEPLKKGKSVICIG